MPGARRVADARRWAPPQAACAGQSSERRPPGSPAGRPTWAASPPTAPLPIPSVLLPPRGMAYQQGGFALLSGTRRRTSCFAYQILALYRDQIGPHYPCVAIDFYSTLLHAEPAKLAFTQTNFNRAPRLLARERQPARAGAKRAVGRRAHAMRRVHGAVVAHRAPHAAARRRARYRGRRAGQANGHAPIAAGTGGIWNCAFQNCLCSM